MKTLATTVCALPVLLTPGLAWSQDRPGCPTTSVAEIDALADRLNAAWASGDPDAVTALFTADPVLLPTLSPVPRTKPTEVRAYFVDFLKLKPQARIDTSTTEIDCGTARRVGTWTVTITDAATGAVRAVAARYSLIYRHDNGDWKIDHLHSSVAP